MRYQEETQQPHVDGPVYSQTAGLHFMLNFTVALGLVIGVILLWLGRKGRVMWLQVWSVGLILFSIVYLAMAVLGLVR